MHGEVVTTQRLGSHLVRVVLGGPGLDEFVSTGRYYGHGCACLTVITDPEADRVLAIGTSKRLPLSTCEADPSLPVPADW